MSIIDQIKIKYFGNNTENYVDGSNKIDEKNSISTDVGGTEDQQVEALLDSLKDKKMGNIAKSIIREIINIIEPKLSLEEIKSIVRAMRSQDQFPNNIAPKIATVLQNEKNIAKIIYGVHNDWVMDNSNSFGNIEINKDWKYVPGFLLPFDEIKKYFELLKPVIKAAGGYDIKKESVKQCITLDKGNFLCGNEEEGRPEINTKEDLAKALQSEPCFYKQLEIVKKWAGNNREKKTLAEILREDPFLAENMAIQIINENGDELQHAKNEYIGYKKENGVHDTEEAARFAKEIDLKIDNSKTF